MAVERWRVRSPRREVMGYFTTEAAARDRDGQGRLVEDNDGAFGWRYDLPPGWAVERVEIEDLTAAQAEAVAMAAKECDGGCAHCLDHQLEVLTSIWPHIPWTAVVQSISTVIEDTVGFDAEWEAAAGAVDEGHGDDGDDPTAR